MIEKSSMFRFFCNWPNKQAINSQHSGPQVGHQVRQVANQTKGQHGLFESWDPPSQLDFEEQQNLQHNWFFGTNNMGRGQEGKKRWKQDRNKENAEQKAPDRTHNSETWCTRSPKWTLPRFVNLRGDGSRCSSSPWIFGWTPRLAPRGKQDFVTLWKPTVLA